MHKLLKIGILAKNTRFRLLVYREEKGANINLYAELI